MMNIESRKYKPCTQPPSSTKSDVDPANKQKPKKRSAAYKKRRATKRKEEYKKILTIELLEFLLSVRPSIYYDDGLFSRLREHGLNVCSMDMEMARIRMLDGSRVTVPVWIVIMTRPKQIIYHEFVRHPNSAIIDQDFGTELHGLIPRDARRGKCLNQVRKEVFKLLLQYDRIIVSGQINDFAALFLSVDDHLKLLPKIVCVSSYYNCRMSNDGLGLKFCAFLMFNFIMPDSSHSPLLDAALALLLYLVDIERIEKLRPQLKMKSMDQGYYGFEYPKNVLMSRLLNDTMAHIGDWPKCFKYGPFDDEFSRRNKSNLQKFKPDEYVKPTTENDTPYPYKFDETRKRSVTIQKLRLEYLKQIELYTLESYITESDSDSSHSEPNEQRPTQTATQLTSVRMDNKTQTDNQTIYGLLKSLIVTIFNFICFLVILYFFLHIIWKR